MRFPEEHSSNSELTKTHNAYVDAKIGDIRSKPAFHFFSIIFETESCYAAHAGLELVILMPWLSCRHNAITFSCFQIFGAKQTPVCFIKLFST